MKTRYALVVGAAGLVTLLSFGFSGAQTSALASPGSGYRARSPEYGLSTFVFGRPQTTDRDLDKVAALGFGWQKSLFRWRDIEADCKGCFNWAEADRVVKASAAHRLKVIARLDFQPRWASAAHNGPPDNYQDLADFVYAFVDHFKQGSPNGAVGAIEVWNEVNLNREWGMLPIDRQSAADYVRLLGAAYAAAKAADPSVTVITAGLSPNGVSDPACCQPDDVYLNWMFESGLQGKYDVVGANANVQCPCVDAPLLSVPGFGHESFYFRRVEQLHEIMASNGDGDKQVWLMEFGWTTDRVNPGYAWYATTEDVKAELIIQAFQFANRTWSPWIGVMTLWTIADPGWAPDDEQVWWSITNPDGSTRPAYERLRQARAAGQLP